MSTLVVDSSPRALSQLAPGQILARTYAESETWLHNHHDHLLSAIVVNPAFLIPGGIELVRMAHQARPSTPIYFLFDNEPHFSEAQLARLAVSGSLKRDELFSALERFSLFERQIGLDSRIQPGSIVTDPDTGHKYVPVAPQDYYFVNRSFFDVYLRIAGGKFIKILSANDSFTEERLSVFIHKGVQNFYLSHEALQRCFGYCTFLAKVVLGCKDVAPEIKISHVLSQGVEVSQQLRQGHVNVESIELLGQFLSSVKVLLHELPSSSGTLLDTLTTYLPLYDHAVSVTLIAALLSKELGIESFSAYKTVGMAAMLHDIGLYQMPEAFWTEDTRRLSPDELSLYRTHPQIGAQSLAKYPAIDEAVVQAVLQHHERRDSSGFPGKLGAGKISKLAEIVGISDEFIRILGDSPLPWNNGRPYLMDRMQKEAYFGFSLEVVEAFKKAFGPLMK